MSSNVTAAGLWQVLKKALVGFRRDGVMKMSASLAFYTIITMGPMLIVIIFLANIFWKRSAAEATVLAQIERLAGPKAAQQVEAIISNAGVSGENLYATSLGIGALIIGATTVFADMQNSLNQIWHLRSNFRKGWKKLLLARLMSSAIIGSLGFLLLVSLVVNALLDLLMANLKSVFQSSAVTIVYIINVAFMFLIISSLFALIFKVLPDAKIRLRDVLPGAVFTAMLFMVARFGVSFYLGRVDLGSTYGAAGSLVVLLFWVYYSSIVLYLGAEFTKAYTVAYGAVVTPNQHAVTLRRIDEESNASSVQENEAQHDEAHKVKKDKSESRTHAER